MSKVASREIARLRQGLHERLMSQREDGAGELLARFSQLAETAALPSGQELRAELERWRLRFEILASGRQRN